MPKEHFVAAASNHAHDSNYKIWEQSTYTEARLSPEFRNGVCQALSCIFLFMNYTRQALAYDSKVDSDYGKTDPAYLKKYDHLLKRKAPLIDLQKVKDLHFPSSIFGIHHNDGTATFREFLRWSESAILISSLQAIEHKKGKDLDPHDVGYGPTAKVEMILNELTKGNMIVDEGGSFPVDPDEKYATLKKFAKWGYYLLQFSNHAMAVVVREYAAKCKFFDPNYGIVQFWDTASLIGFAREFIAAERPNEAFTVVRLV